jgi:oxygen tolerance protein BatD
VIAALMLLAAVQGPPDVTATVNRSRLKVGDQVTLTVRARSHIAEPLAIALPSLAGFAIVGSRDFTEVAIDGAGPPVRTTSRSLELRADRAGTLVIGPITVRQGAVIVQTAPITVAVDSAAVATGGESALGALARSLLEAAPPPRSARDVSLTVVVTADTVLVGQQLDIVAAAWFPREVRNRLRRAPIVTLPTPAGVWAYPPTVPEGVALSRKVRGEWMDLFVAHQVVFPLAPGRIVLPPVSLEYTLPVTFSFFSREERYELHGDSTFVVAAAPPLPPASPGAGRADDDQSVVGRDLTLDVTVEPTDTRVGEPIDVTATVSGIGNAALWADPALRWPSGFRAYPAQMTTRLAPQAGVVAGSKTFHYLVVPDSAGSFLLPEVRYRFYDLGKGAFAVARVAPRTIAVAQGVEPRAARALPVLLAPAPPGWMARLLGDLPWWAWPLVWLLPPALWLLGRMPRATAVVAAVPAAQLSRLGRLEREFQGILANHVPDPEVRDGDGLAPALRAASVEPAVAEHVMRLRDRLRSARYGPRGVGDPAELAAELEQVLRVLRGEGHGRRIRRLTLAGAAALAALTAPASPQRAGAEALYEAGALRAAADSFAARAAAEPLVAAHWYDLGATLYRAGADGKATAAWTLAARLAPRNAVILRARRLLPPPDGASESLLAVGPGTPAEWGVAATLLWGLAWAAAFGRRPRWAIGLGGVAVIAAALGGIEWRRRERPVAVVLAPGTAVRVAPYGSASATTSLEAGAAVLLEDHYGAWVRVGRADGVRGWMLARDVTTL